MTDGEAFLPLPSVCHLRVLARTVGTGDTQVCPLLSCFGAIWQEAAVAPEGFSPREMFRSVST